MTVQIPSVSIIIPTFKRAEQTKHTLELLYQSNEWNKRFLPEVIVVDATPDNSVKNITSSFSNPNIIYIHPKQTGIAVNKNAGSKIVKNEILIFCDSDIEVEPDTLINSLRYLKNHPKVAQVTGQVIWRGGGRDGKLDRPRIEDRRVKIEGSEFIEAIYSRYMATYKSLFWQVGGYDSELFNMRGEGSDLSIRYWRSGLPLAYWDKIKVHHVEEVEAAATRHIEHPERGIIRDLIQLGYKYGLSRDESPNFAKTLSWLTDEFKESDKYIIIESIVELLPYFWENRQRIEKSRGNIPSLYDFKFLDVFTKKEIFLECIEKAQGRLKEARLRAFRV